MDNALIDDRRIHVDFSQSVAKLWSQYRRKDNQPGKGEDCYVINILCIKLILEQKRDIIKNKNPSVKEPDGHKSSNPISDMEDFKKCKLS